MMHVGGGELACFCTTDGGGEGQAARGKQSQLYMQKSSVKKDG